MFCSIQGLSFTNPNYVFICEPGYPTITYYYYRLGSSRAIMYRYEVRIIIQGSPGNSLCTAVRGTSSGRKKRDIDGKSV